MRAPAFWQGGRSGPATGLSARLPAMLLAAGPPGSMAALPPGAWAVPSSVRRCQWSAIGNFTVGGTGKTPAALAIAALLEEIGERPAFLHARPWRSPARPG